MFTWWPCSMIDFDNLYYKNANSKNFLVVALSCNDNFFLIIIFRWTVFWQVDPEVEVNPPKPTETTGSGMESDEVGNSANFRSYRAYYTRAPKFVFLTRGFSGIASFASISGRLNLSKRSQTFSRKFRVFFSPLTHALLIGMFLHYALFSRSTYPSQLGELWAILFSTS